LPRLIAPRSSLDQWQLLTKSGQPLSRNYEYAARIENPGEDPSIWSVEVLTPFDMPLFGDQTGQAAYMLSIVDVSGSTRSQPLEVYYRQPLVYIPRVITSLTAMTSTRPAGASRIKGPCPAARRSVVSVCWRKPGDSAYTVATMACNYPRVEILLNGFGLQQHFGACS
jgi:hypothetical protein